MSAADTPTEAAAVAAEYQAEIDRLKTEVTGLRGGIEASEATLRTVMQQRDRLVAQLDEARRPLDRYFHELAHSQAPAEYSLDPRHAAEIGDRLLDDIASAKARLDDQTGRQQNEGTS